MRGKGVLYNYLMTNKKSFISIISVFFVGMILGIFMINNTGESEILEINKFNM